MGEVLAISQPSAILRKHLELVVATPEAMFHVCSQCGEQRQPGETSCYWRGAWHCSRECCHAAGDRTACSRWECGCSRYAKKRRLLRGHREQMRVMMDLIEDNDLEEELQEDMIAETGNTNYWLGYTSDMDEASDVEEPEAALKKEVEGLKAEKADKQAMVSAVQGALECRSVLTDLERARMQMEDVRSSAQRGRAIACQVLRLPASPSKARSWTPPASRSCWVASWRTDSCPASSSSCASSLMPLGQPP